MHFSVNFGVFVLQYTTQVPIRQSSKSPYFGHEFRESNYLRTRTVVTREYNIFSRVQEEELQVRIPGRVGAKTFDFRQQVDLVNPRLIAEGRNIGGSAYVDYVIEAEDIVVAGGVK